MSLKLTRAQLAAFIRDPQTLRQFEKLVVDVSTDIPTVSEGVAVEASLALSYANLAIEMLSMLDESLGLEPPVENVDQDIFDAINDPLVFDDYLPNASSVSMVDISDLIVGSVSDRHVLAYNSTTGFWETSQRLETQRASPAATGFSVSVTSPTSLIKDVWFLLTPTGAFASGTINLPSSATSVDQQTVRIFCTQQVSSVSLLCSGGTVKGAPTALGADSWCSFRYDSTTTTWYREA
jgi:hypothetical protein